jgi:hypothetical protein
MKAFAHGWILEHDCVEAATPLCIMLEDDNRL